MDEPTDFCFEYPARWWPKPVWQLTHVDKDAIGELIEDEVCAAISHESRVRGLRFFHSDVRHPSGNMVVAISGLMSHEREAHEIAESLAMRDFSRTFKVRGEEVFVSVSLGPAKRIPYWI